MIENTDRNLPSAHVSDASTVDGSRRNLLRSAAMAAPASLLLAAGASNVTAASGRPGQGKTALVTGSSRGIGAAIVKRLAANGYAVTINYLRNRDLAAQVARDIEATGGKAIFEQADVSDAQAVRRLFDKHQDAFGAVDVVVANAGIQRLGTFADMGEEDYARLIDVNMKGVFHTLRESARRVSDGGRIIALSSGTTRMRPPAYGPYAASKAAVEVFVNILAKELAGRMISVNAVAPGTTDTTLFTDGKTPEQISAFARMTPHQRLGQPDDIARVVSLLASERGAWINAQVVHANGGLS